MTSPNLGGLDKFAIEPEKVDKPWGHELIWAKTERYVGKTLFLKAGESLSLQFHKVKDEAWKRRHMSRTRVKNSCRSSLLAQKG